MSLSEKTGQDKRSRLVIYLDLFTVYGTDHNKSAGGIQKKIVQGMVSEKKNVERRSEEQNSCRVNSTVRLKKCAHQKDTLAATLFAFSGSWLSPWFNWFSLQIIMKSSLSGLIQFGTATLLHVSWIYTGSHGLKAIEPCVISTAILLDSCFKSLNR